MKIAFIIDDITNSGGTERVVANLCNYFVSKELEVEVHSLTSGGEASFFVLDPRVQIAHYGLSGYSNESNRLRKVYLKIVNTFRSIKHFSRVDADVVFGTGKHINIYLTFFNRKKKVIKIGCEHFSYNAPMSQLVRVMRRWRYPKLQRLIVLNKADYNYYSSFMKGVERIPNFVSVKVDETSNLEHKTVLAIGRHNVEKGFDTLLNIWQGVHRQHPDWKLCIVGDGPLLEDHKRLAEKLNIKDAVIFEKPIKDVVSKYLAASVYAMTSRTESFGMVLLEAMQCGVPCVSFDCDAGPRDIIINEVTGLLLPVGDLDAMERALNKLIADPQLRRKMGIQAREESEKFSLENIGQQWIELLATISKA